MPTEMPDSDRQLLPEALLKPTAWRSNRPYWLVLGMLALFMTASVAIVWWPYSHESENPWVEKRDPIEDDPQMKPILDAADRDTEQALAGDDPELKKRLGYCHRVWGVKKRILRKKYGVEWHTPAELNPKIAYD